jgi:acetate kinase
MNVLVLNAGSSSLKFQIIATDMERIRQYKDERLCRGEIERAESSTTVIQSAWPSMADMPQEIDIPES